MVVARMGGVGQGAAVPCPTSACSDAEAQTALRPETGNDHCGFLPRLQQNGKPESAGFQRPALDTSFIMNSTMGFAKERQIQEKNRGGHFLTTKSAFIVSPIRS